IVSLLPPLSPLFPYTTLFRSLFPALLYYLGVIAQVHFRAGKDNLKGIPKADLPLVKEVLKERGHLMIPIFALVYFLANNLPISRSEEHTSELQSRFDLVCRLL